MTDSENLLQAFHSFANLFEPIWFWKMDSAFHVLQSDCPHESLFRSLLLREGRREAIEAHIATTDRPVCFTVPSMLSWIIGFAPEGGKIHNIYLVGPFFLDYKDPESSADRMAQTDLTQEAQAALQAALPTLPVLSSETLVQYAVILHYCIRQERLAPSEVVHYVARPKTRKHSKSVETNQFEKSSGRWSMEQDLLNEAKHVWEHRDTYKTAAQAIGYKEFFPYFAGESALAPCVEKLKQASRNYAKRQLTWFRHMEGICWLDASAPDVREQAACLTNEFLAKG